MATTKELLALLRILGAMSIEEKETLLSFLLALRDRKSVV